MHYRSIDSMETRLHFIQCELLQSCLKRINASEQNALQSYKRRCKIIKLFLLDQPTVTK